MIDHGMVQEPKQSKQQAPVAVVVPTTMSTTSTTMVQKPKQMKQEAFVAVVVPTTTTTTTTMVHNGAREVELVDDTLRSETERNT